ncbi:MAG: repair protein RecO [Patescibacteria group bacterium]|nr:repair protein RecO [Patescibacteria group bacterium]
MSHHIYQTKAFIIDSVDVGEANKLLTIFTADLGLIHVSAQGVRIMKSKLRPSIQDLSYSKIALVRGKEYWRLTSAEKLISLYDKRVHLSVRKLMARVLMFVKRLTAGETKHEELFDMLSKLFTFCFENSKQLADSQKTSPEDSILNTLELIINFRILESLGYGSDDAGFDEIRNMFDWNIAMIENLVIDQERIKKIAAHVNQAIVSSHL